MSAILLLLAAVFQTAGSVYLVSQKAASTVAWYTPEGQLLGTASTGKHPHEMILSPDGRHLYVTDNGTMRIEQAGAGGNTVSIIDLAARRRTGEIALGKFRRPHGIDLDRTTGRLVVSTELPDRLLLLDPAARKVLRDYDTRGKTAHMVTLGPRGLFAYVSNSSSGNVAIINLANREVKLVATGPRPEGSALAPGGREVYVGNRDGNTVTVIDTARNEVAAQIPTGKGSVRLAVTPDGRHVVCGLYHENAIEILDARARKSVGKVPLPLHIVSLTLSRDGALAFASAEDQDTVFVVSLAARKLVRRFTTASGAHPDPVLEILPR